MMMIDIDVGVCVVVQVNRPLTMKKDGIQTRNRKTSVKSKRHKKNYALPPSAAHHRHQHHLTVTGQPPLDLPPGYDRPAHYLAAVHGFAGSTGALGPSPGAGLGSHAGGRSPYVHHAGGGGGGGGPADGLAAPFMAAAFGHDGYGATAERFGPVAAAAAVHLAGLNCMAGSTRQGMIGAVA